MIPIYCFIELMYISAQPHPGIELTISSEPNVNLPVGFNSSLYYFFLSSLNQCLYLNCLTQGLNSKNQSYEMSFTNVFQIFFMVPICCSNEAICIFLYCLTQELNWRLCNVCMTFKPCLFFNLLVNIFQQADAQSQRRMHKLCSPEYVIEYNQLCDINKIGRFLPHSENQRDQLRQLTYDPVRKRTKNFVHSPVSITAQGNMYCLGIKNQFFTQQKIK